MLRLIDVCKSFKYGKNKVLVLDKINLDFKKHELVFILGKSGSGKSTLLNIIGGLLEIDSGSVLLDDRDITKFNNKMLCNYRNNMIGFVFQNYHLIEYMSVIDNIKLGMTIQNDNYNGIDDILKKLGIYHKRKIKVNKLSGGEKQRVAIARAIINNPDIILCDEPTGALDTYNGINIMKILKEISRDKLVIVVSHNSNLASEYADRVINIVDGKVDYYPQMDDGKFKKISKKRICLLQIIKLAIRNLWLKKGRVFFTSLAISVGFLCLLLVLCLSRSFNEDIDRLEEEVVSVFPISVYNGEFEMVDSEIISSDNEIINRDKSDYVYTNRISKKYLDYINKIDEINYISYEYDISFPIISDRYKLLDYSYMKILPNNLIDGNYEVLYGDIPKDMNEIVLKVDSNNNVVGEMLDVFDIDTNIKYEEIVGRKFRVILNDLYYVKNGDYYYINNNAYEMYNNSDIELEIVGIIKEKEIVDNNNYFYYTGELFEYVTSINSNSEIVSFQIDNDYNVLGTNIDKYSLLSYFGYETLPIGVDMYVSNLGDKEKVLNKLDEYNKNNDKLIYVDTMKDAIDIFKNIISIISVILIFFSLISILVSSMMIFILTNNRVMERIREIGILKSLGARNKDIARLFNVENFVIGIISSLIGIFVILMLEYPINMLIGKIMDGEGLFNIYNDLVIISVLFNIFIVVLSGYIPTKLAGRKKIIECLSDRC